MKSASTRIEGVLECPVCGKSGFSKQSIAGHVEMCLNKVQEIFPDSAETTRERVHALSKIRGLQNRKTAPQSFAQQLGIVDGTNVTTVVESSHQYTSDSVTDKFSYYSELGIKVNLLYSSSMDTLSRVLFVQDIDEAITAERERVKRCRDTEARDGSKLSRAKPDMLDTQLLASWMPLDSRANVFGLCKWDCGHLDAALSRVDTSTPRGLDITNTACATASITTDSDPLLLTPLGGAQNGLVHERVRLDVAASSNQVKPMASTLQPALSCTAAKAPIIVDVMDSDSESDVDIISKAPSSHRESQPQHHHASHLHLRGRLVRAVRPDGATIRDALDIDNSEPVGRYAIFLRHV
jgi:hypothetical protein